VASILSLIAGLIVGVIAGWLLRGRRVARTQPAEAPVPVGAARSTEAESAQAESAVAADDAEKVPALVGAKSGDAEVSAQSPAPAAEKTPEPAVAEPATPEPMAEGELVEAEPVVARTVAEPDDLTRIAGIGPKMAMALAASGITTFEQLAAATLPDIRSAVAAAGMRLAPTAPTWPEQAKALARITG
jgi:predicted flap endonuclease-1-like 5' DNA nuclease